MIGPQPVVWIVASSGTTTRWTALVQARGIHAVPLPWGDVAPPEDPAAVAGALKARAHDVVLLTSAYGARYVNPKDAQGWQAVCVGERTAAAARDCGFDVIFVGTSDAASLARELVDQAAAIERVLFLRGLRAREDAVHVFLDAGKRVDEITAYQVEVSPTFGDRCASAEDPHAIWAGSPRAVECLHHALLKRGVIDRGRTPAAAMGKTTADALQARGFRNVIVAPHPSAEALADAIARALTPEGGA